MTTDPQKFVFEDIAIASYLLVGSLSIRVAKFAKWGTEKNQDERV